MRRPRREDETTVLSETGVSSSFRGGTGFGRGAGSVGAADASGQGGSPLAATFGAGQIYGAGQTYGASAAGQDATHAEEPQITAETVVVRVRRHGRHLVWPVFFLIAVAGASGFFIGALPEPWMNLTAGAGAVVLALFIGIGPILNWLARRVVVTTRRVIVHHGFFVRHRSEVSLARVREVKSRQNPIQRLWGSGDIDLFVGTEATRIPDAPGLRELHGAIQELAERSYDEHVRATGFAF